MGFALSLVLIVVFCYVGSCRKAGLWLVKSDKSVQADAIVMLMGSITDRVQYTVDLYKKGMAARVIMVENLDASQVLKTRGVSILSDVEQSRNAFVALGIPPDSIIILPGNATSTQMEALIIREYLASKPESDTILLITSAPHTRRASMIFQYAFRKAGMSVLVVCNPNTYTNFDGPEWWKDRENIQTVLLEFLKIGNFVMFERGELN